MTDQLPTIVFHSDRGTQYTCSEFTHLLAEHEHGPVAVAAAAVLGQRGGGELSVSLKLELIHLRSWATRAQVRRAVFDYIEVFHNRQRLTRRSATSPQSNTNPPSTNTTPRHVA